MTLLRHKARNEILTPLYRYQHYVEVWDRNETKLLHCVTPHTQHRHFTPSCCLNLQGRMFLQNFGTYLLITWQHITEECTLIQIKMRNSNLHQSLFILPDDGGSTILWNNGDDCYQHTWCHTPEPRCLHRECYDNLKSHMPFKTTVTVCIRNLVRYFCAIQTRTLCRMLLLPSSGLQVCPKQWYMPEL